MIEGIRLAAERASVGLPDLDAILHGTTVATNAVLERRGALCGLIVTKGFRHILHLAEAWTPGPLFGFMVYEKPEPLTDTRYVREVPERTGADGSIIEPIDEAAVRAAVEELVADGVEALTVCLLNAHANGRHERVIAEIAASVAPDLPLSISSEILPEFREYERTVTTLMNAYVAPALEKYLTNVRDGLAAAHVRAPIQVVRSDGGLMSLESACKNPVQTVLSGPAGGVSGASFVASHAGFDRILTFDMGGTSTDVAVCVSGRPEITRETNVGDFPVRAPAVDVASIGAGGGSIAYVAEATGALRVGPESAGALPGPACYGRGGTGATVTDANVVLGHLPPRLLGGEFELDVDAAHAAVARVAEARGTGVEETARAIVDMVDEAMLGALRVVTVQRGRVPSEFALVAFGGAGGLHANALAKHPRLLSGDRAGGVRRALGARVHLLRDQERVQPDVREDHRDDDAGRRPRAVRGAHVPRARLARRGERRRRRPGRPLHPRHALQPPGLRDPDRAGRHRARRARPRRAGAAVRRGPQPPLRLRARGRLGDRQPPGRRRRAAFRCPSSRRARKAARIPRRRRRARSASGRPRGRSTSRPTPAPRSSRE